MPERTTEEESGLWVTNGTDEPRQLTAPCIEHPEDTPEGLWTWSPTGSRLGVIQVDHLILIDPATGDRTDLGQYGNHSLHRSYLVANADGTRDIHEIDELQYRRWRGGWYFCECYG